ncbi:MAG: hypothetical protein ACP5QO_15230, partial [Clostridia bacterium]
MKRPGHRPTRRAIGWSIEVGGGVGGLYALIGPAIITGAISGMARRCLMPLGAGESLARVGAVVVSSVATAAATVPSLTGGVAYHILQFEWDAKERLCACCPVGMWWSWAWRPCL